MGGPLILHYHAIGDVSRSRDPDNLVISPDRLRYQLGVVARAGYRFARLAELVAKLNARSNTSGLCGLTFDDGTVDNLILLPAISREFQAPATVYACPGLAGELHASIAPEAGVRLLTIDELRELAGIDGIEIGSHTMAHTSLATASAELALQEMSSSKQALEEILGMRVDSFAYPGCCYSPACPDAARKAGYTSAVTCARLGSLDPFELRRTSPDRLDNRLTMWLKARQLYDPLWSSPPGRLARRLARTARHGRA